MCDGRGAAAPDGRPFEKKPKMLRSLALAAAVAAFLSPAAASAQTAPAGKSSAPAAYAPAARLIDINSATKAELESLPGIAAARSEAIVKGRPYKGKDELVRRSILPQNVYDTIRDRIIAKQG